MNIGFIVYLIFLTGIIILALAQLVYVLTHVQNITDYICVYTGRKKYHIISQRAFFDKYKLSQIRREFKERPIRDKIKAFGKHFEEDFELFFDKLKPNTHYRVITHYSQAIKKAAADGRITLIAEPKVIERRTLRELRRLLGFKDYKLARCCIKKKPHLKRCCDKCKRKENCKCRMGGVCKAASVKMFVQYDFVVNK